MATKTTIYKSGLYSDGNAVNTVTRVESISVRRRRPKGIALLQSMTGWVYEKHVEHRGAYWNDPNRASVWRAADLLSQEMVCTDAAKDKAKLALLGSVNEVKLNVGVFLGELSETMNFVAGSAKRVFSTYRLMKKGRFGEALDALLGTQDGRPPKPRPVKGLRGNRRERAAFFSWAIDNGRIARAMGDNWLAYRYAVMPIVYDVDAALEVLNSSDLHRDKYMIYKARGTGRHNFNDQTATSTGRYTRQSVRVKVSDVLYYRISPDWGAGAQLRRFGFNPVATGWELVPFSFVADWFFDIGARLAALDALMGVSYVGFAASIRVSLRNENRYSHGTGKLDGVNWYTKEKYYRDLALGSPYPSLFPVYQPSLSAKRLLDAVALGRGITQGSSVNLGRI